MMKDLVFGHGDDTEYSWQSRPFKGRQVKRRNGKGKGEGKDPKELVRHTLVKNKQTSMNGGQKIVLGGQREKEARKVLRKVNYPSESDSRTYHPEKREQAMISARTKEEARIRKETFQPRKHQVKKDMAIPGNRTIGIPV